MEFEMYGFHLEGIVRMIPFIIVQAFGVGCREDRFS